MQAYGMSEKWAGLFLTGLTNSQSLFVIKSAVCVTESLLRDDENWEIYLFEYIKSWGCCLPCVSVMGAYYNKS